MRNCLARFAAQATRSPAMDSEPNLAHAWAETVRRNPTAIALIEGATGRTWTRADIAAESARWRAELTEATRTRLRGRRVVIAEPNGAAWLRVFLGLIEAGAIPAALDPTEPPSAQNAVAHAIGAAWCWRHNQLEPVASRPAARRRDLCLLKLTSGSTGAPRAHAFTHAHMLADGRQVCASMGIGAADVNLGVIPFGHSYGLGNLVAPLLMQGTAIICASSPLPHALADECARWRATVFPAVPTLLRGMVRADVDPASLATLRLVISAGAPLEPAVAAEFLQKFGRRVQGFYGSSETGGICFDRTGEATLAGRSVGAPLEGVKLEFRRGDRFAVISDAVMRRGRFSPPDRGKLDERGELVLLGRAGRVVKIAGRRLDLAEIEHALRAIDGVRDAYAVSHPRRADALAAVVATGHTAVELRRALGGRLAPWKIPEKLVVVAEFPCTARGKTDLQKLRAWLGAESTAAPD